MWYEIAKLPVHIPELVLSQHKAVFPVPAKYKIDNQTSVNQHKRYLRHCIVMTPVEMTGCYYPCRGKSFNMDEIRKWKTKEFNTMRRKTGGKGLGKAVIRQIKSVLSFKSGHMLWD